MPETDIVTGTQFMSLIRHCAYIDVKAVISLSPRLRYIVPKKSNMRLNGENEEILLIGC
jgi:hypothetical protein